MADALGRDGKRRSWEVSDCPPVASNYVLQILQISFPSMGYRNQRELHTSRGGARSSGCWRDGQSGRSFGATVQSRRALATRRRLVASDPLGAAPTQRAALDFSRRRDAGGEGATRRDAGQALPPGGRDQQPGPRQMARTRAPRPEARNGSVRRERGAERERSRDGKRDKEKDQKKGDGKRRGR